jgi:VCBS repeat-containing protein
MTIRKRQANRMRALVEFQPLESRWLFALSVTPYDPGTSLGQLTGALIVPSTGIALTGSSYIGGNGQAGTFSGFSETSGATTLAIGDGVLLTSGSAVNALGPNNSSGVTTSWGSGGDSDLTALVGASTFDGNALTLQFTTSPGIKSIGFDLVFGSDEFPEYVGSFNDAFGAYLDGVQISTDGNGKPLSVNNNFFTLNNSGSPVAGKTSVSMNLQYDGLTPELQTRATLNTGITTHTLKLVIADAGDSSVDSGIFLSGLAGSTFDPGGSSTGIPASGSFQFDQAAETFANTAGTAAVTVDRVGGSTGAASVDYTTMDGTALAGTDYTTTSGTLNFSDGQTSAIINVPVIANANAAASTTFSVKLSNASSGTSLGSITSSTVTLTNTHSQAQFAASSYAVANNSGNAVVTVTRSGNTSLAGQVHYATADGTAVAGVNYTAASGTLSFGVGQTSKTISIPLNAAVSGPAVAFTVTISNPGGNAVLGSPAMTTVTIHTPPVAVNDHYATPENTQLVKNAAAGVLVNDTDADNNPLTAILVTGPTHGSLILNPDGSFTYTPANGYTGQDHFTYKDNDGFFSGNTATVSLKVDTAPVGKPDSYVTFEDTLLAKNAAAGVLANDTDAEGDTLMATLATGPTHGSVALNSDGSFNYTPATGYFGGDSFTYIPSDGTASGSATLVSLTVNAVPDHLIFLQQPASTIAGQTMGAVKVEIVDKYGNLVTSDTSAVTLSPEKGTKLGGTLTVHAIGGVATFSNLMLTKAGIHQLTATETGRGGALSNTFTISAAAAKKLVIQDQPTTGKAKQTLGAVAVAVEDTYGNVVTSNHSNVTLTKQPVGVVPSGSMLLGTTTVATKNGVAVFSDLVITKSGIYTLTAADAGFTNVVSAPITIQDLPSLVSIMHSTTTTSKVLNLSILGADISGLGESALKYTWSVAKGPGGTQSVLFDDNGTNSAKNTPARFRTAGIFHLRCLITNQQGNSVMGSVTITVKQVLTSFRLSPHHQIIPAGSSVQYNGVELDQFGHTMHIPQTVTYQVLSGRGSIDQTGLFTASRKPGHVVIQISVNETVGVVGASVV